MHCACSYKLTYWLNLRLHRADSDICDIWLIGSVSVSLVALGFLGQQHGLDVWQNASLGDGNSAQQLVELLVVADGELEVPGDDAGLLVVPGRVPSQLEDLGRQVLQDCSQIDGGTGADPLGVASLSEQPAHTAHRELQSSSGRACLGLSAGLASLLSASRHGKQLL
ncbi:hypothetical protein NDU88_003163 [Pleurodeles waltl]|uniref:Uncharacterized protein n=1 Tax=Pleurodeles waltl TaxID=8319 RepID=A0AAV7MPZ7_PLEWA|nr:hypothetical protein NDU88_003163 [Pleurodeles waltl]